LGGGNQRIGDLAIHHSHAGDLQNGDLRAVVGDAMQQCVQDRLGALRLGRANHGITIDTLADWNQGHRDPHHRGMLRRSPLLEGLGLAGLKGMPNRNVP
jgi:hypothetical protein